MTLMIQRYKMTVKVKLIFCFFAFIQLFLSKNYAQIIPWDTKWLL